MYSEEGLDPPQMFRGLVKYAVITYMFPSEIHGDFKASTPGAVFGSLSLTINIVRHWIK